MPPCRRTGDRQGRTAGRASPGGRGVTRKPAPPPQGSPDTALRRRAALADAVLETSSLGVVMVDGAGRIVRTNARLARDVRLRAAGARRPVARNAPARATPGRSHATPPRLLRRPPGATHGIRSRAHRSPQGRDRVSRGDQPELRRERPGPPGARLRHRHHAPPERGAAPSRGVPGDAGVRGPGRFGGSASAPASGPVREPRLGSRRVLARGRRRPPVRGGVASAGAGHEGVRRSQSQDGAVMRDGAGRPGLGDRPGVLGQVGRSPRGRPRGRGRPDRAEARVRVPDPRPGHVHRRHRAAESSLARAR